MLALVFSGVAALVLFRTPPPATAQGVSNPFTIGVRYYGTTLPGSCPDVRRLFRLTQVDGANQPGLYVCNGSTYAAVDGSSIPAGAVNRVPYYTSATALGNEAGFEYDASSNTLTVGALITTGAGYTNFASQSDSTTTGDFWRNSDLFKFRASGGTRTLATLEAANSWADGVKQTFNPDGTNAGLNVGSQAGDPSSLANGDIWYDSTAGTLDARINGATVNLGASGGQTYHFNTASGTSPADATTYYLGHSLTGFGFYSTDNDAKIEILQTCTIKAVAWKVYVGGTLGSNENVTISLRKNDTTDTALTSTDQWTAALQRGRATGLSIAMTAGDFFSIKIVTPTWATNPTSVAISGDVLCQ